MSARAIRAGGAYVEFSIHDKVTRQIDAMGKKIHQAGMGMAKAGAGLAAGAGAVAAPFVAATKQFADFGDQLHKMSARTGVGVESLSELGHAAELSGTSLDTVGQAMQKMNRRVGRMTAGQGSNTQVEAMQELGLSLEQLERMSPEQQFMALADAVSGYGNQAQAAGLAQRAFGTQIDDLLPMFASGSEGIRDMMTEARELGITMGKDDAEAAAKLTDAIATLKAGVRGVAPVESSCRIARSRILMPVALGALRATGARHRERSVVSHMARRTLCICCSRRVAERHADDPITGHPIPLCCDCPSPSEIRDLAAQIRDGHGQQPRFPRPHELRTATAT